MEDHLEPLVFVIFGGAGDLTWRKLVPSLFTLWQNGRLPEKFAIVIVDRSDMSEVKLRQHFFEGVKKFSSAKKAAQKAWKEFSEQIFLHVGDFKKAATYTALSQLCKRLEKEWKVEANRIFYLATPPSMFIEIPKYLKGAGLNDKKNSRLVIEKPFGYDLETAVNLNRILYDNFDESQIFRIDHYLGKETVQNILAFRFANPMFEPIWNRRYIEFVAITVAEEVGVEHRGGYYERAGALRDMVQNHLMQLLCLIAMEPMVSFDADEIRNKKVDVLHALRPLSHGQVHQTVVRGQYSKGWINGKAVRGYREEPGVSVNSNTETFAALKVFVDNWRWQNVPFYLRTGKRMACQNSEIYIQFRSVPHRSFPIEASLDWHPASLVMSIQPVQGIVLKFQAKFPGPKMNLRHVEMRFNYEDEFKIPSPGAYETLLWDVMKNDLTLFMRSDQIEAAWCYLMPVLDMWSASPPSDFPNYEAGTWGPDASNWLLAQEGHNWPIPTCTI